MMDVISSKVVAGLLELEVTESMVVEDIDATIAMIEELRAMGVKIAIDDFGTGHAGFAYLMQLPADRLKLDRMFMNDLVDEHGRRQRGALVVQGIADLAHLLGMEVVTEEGAALGRIDSILETGSNDVYVVHGSGGERLIPAIRDVIKEVDTKTSRMTVRVIEGLFEDNES